jgi:hypothetical protein
MRSVLPALAAAAAFFAPVVSHAATLDLTGAVGAAITAGNSDTAVTGDAAFGTVTLARTRAGAI